MTVSDFEKMQEAQAAHREIAEVVEANLPGVSSDKLDEIANAAVGLHISPETMQRILSSFDALAEAVKSLAATLADLLKPIVDWAAKISGRIYETIAAGIVPRRWLHLSKHAKKARTRKKYRNRIRRAVFAALAAEGGGSS